MYAQWEKKIEIEYNLKCNKALEHNHYWVVEIEWDPIVSLDR